MGLLLHRLAAGIILAFEALACLASVALLVVLAAAPLYMVYLPFEPLPWQWAAAFLAACAIAVAASWVKGIFDRRLPARIGGEPRHAHISGWTFVWIVLATSVIVALATWAAGSEANRETINTDWGERILVGLAIAFVVAALIPTMNLADRAAGAIDAIGKVIRPFGRLLSILDSILVFAVAGAAGVTQGSLRVRYAALFSTLGACAVMGYWLEPPWGLAPLAWGFAVAIAISRRWAWIEADRELAMLNRRFVGPHLRIGFAQDLRDEALLSFSSLLLLVPLALRQAQIAALDAHYELFNIDLEGAENLRTWIGFFGTELAKAVPFVDWAEVYDVGGAEDGIIRSPVSQHFVFATRILVDLVFLAALLQALSISARNAAQRGLFYEGQLDRLDPFLEPHEFRKLLRRGESGALEPDAERVGQFPSYDPIRLSELAGESKDRQVRSAVNAVRVQQGGSNIGEFHQELARRTRASQRDKEAILQVVHAIRAAGPDRDVALLGELRRDLRIVPRLVEVRVEVARLIAEAPDGSEKARALRGALEGERDTLGPIRLIALTALGEAAQRGDGDALAALRDMARSRELEGAERNTARAFLRHARKENDAVARANAPAPTTAPETPPAEAAKVLHMRARRRANALGWIGLGAFVMVGAAAIFLWQNQEEIGGPGAPTAPVVEAERASVERSGSEAANAPAPPTIFQDCASCPRMATLGGGRYLMGASGDDPQRQPWESPQHEVALQAYAIGTHEVTFAEWDACVTAGGCNRYAPPGRGWGRGRRPIMMVSWRDAQRYMSWLSQRTGRAYRLPTEAEWEFAARGGTSTRYWWGDEFRPDIASTQGTVEVGATGQNGFGLHEVTGNVAEWVHDCYVNNYLSAPDDGRAVLRGDCARRVVRGGSWRDAPSGLRVASRSRVEQTVRDAGIGFRVAASVEVDE